MNDKELDEPKALKYLLEQISKTCDVYSVGKQPKEEIVWLVEGHVKSLISDSRTLLKQAELWGRVKEQDEMSIITGRALREERTYTNFAHRVNNWQKARLVQLKAKMENLS